MDTQQVILGFGRANFPATSASYACFRVQAPFNRDTGINSGTQDRGYGKEYMAGAISAYGTLYERKVTHPMGTILILQVGEKRRGAPIRDGALFLRLRDGAPRWKVEGRIPTDACNMHGDRFTMFVGNADILTVDELDSFGIEANRMYREKFMSEEQIDECFILTMEAKEVKPRPNVMVVGEGKSRRTVEVAVAPSRRLRLPKKV